MSFKGLLLIRHGNTFAAGDRIVMVGRNQDLPLVESGRAQAHGAAVAIQDAGIHLERIWTSPLLRASEFAAIIAADLRLKPDVVCIDPRLQEIDFGQWGGLTTAEICAQFGEEVWRQWDQLAKWPNQGQWGSDENSTSQQIRGFMDERMTAVSPELVVTSNGILRSILKLVPAEFEQRIGDGSSKVGTGCFCKVGLNTQSELGLKSYDIDLWNVTADQLPFQKV